MSERGREREEKTGGTRDKGQAQERARDRERRQQKNKATKERREIIEKYKSEG